MDSFQSGGRRNRLLMGNRMPAVCPPKSKLPCSRLYIFFFSVTSADSLPLLLVLYAHPSTQTCSLLVYVSESDEFTLSFEEEYGTNGLKEKKIYTLKAPYSAHT